MFYNMIYAYCQFIQNSYLCIAKEYDDLLSVFYDYT